MHNRQTDRQADRQKTIIKVHNSSIFSPIFTFRKSQSATEYLTTYGFAILIIAITLMLVYNAVSSPLSIVPSTCSFSYGASCNYVAFASNTISSTAKLEMVNSYEYPIINPNISINVSGFGNAFGQCVPNYVLPGGAMLCKVTINNKSESLGTLVSGSIYLTSATCQSGNASSCSTRDKQKISGSFNTHIQSMNDPIYLEMNLSAANYTVPINQPDKLSLKMNISANVQNNFYPFIGATINFTTYVFSGANGLADVSIVPAITNTNSQGLATAYITGTTPGVAYVYGRYGNFLQWPPIVINFVEPSTTSTTLSTTFTSSSTTSTTLSTSSTSTSTTSTSTSITITTTSTTSTSTSTTLSTTSSSTSSSSTSTSTTASTTLTTTIKPPSTCVGGGGTSPTIGGCCTGQIHECGM